MDFTKEPILNLFLDRGEARYDILDVEEQMVGDRMVEATVTYRLADEHEFLNDDWNSDWSQVIDLARHDNYVVMPVSDRDENKKVIRLIDKDLLTPVRKSWKALVEDLQGTYWAIQGDDEVFSFQMELDILFATNQEVHDAIRDVAIQKGNRYLFNRNIYVSQWDGYKKRLLDIKNKINNRGYKKIPTDMLENVTKVLELHHL